MSTEFISRLGNSGWDVDELLSGEPRFDVRGNLRRPDGSMFVTADGILYQPNGEVGAGSAPTSILGERGDGKVLTLVASPGWSYGSIQWVRVAGGTVTPISGQTGTTYTQTAQDVPEGVEIRAIVSGLVYTALSVDRDMVPSAPQNPDPDPGEAAPPVLTGTPSGATVGSMFTFTPTVTGGAAPFTFALIEGSLAGTGLSLNSSTGAISGAPTVPGTLIGLVIRVSDANAKTGQLSLSIVIAGPSMTISGTPASGGTVGSPYTFTPTVTGGFGTKTFSIQTGAVPAGLTLNTSTGQLSGTPTTVGVSSGIVMRVVDQAGTIADLPAFSITVVAAPVALSITGTPTTSARVDSAYAFAPVAAGGVPPRTFSIAAGSLPDGVTLEPSTGLIAGTPTTTGTNTGIIVRVTDSVGSVANLAAFQIRTYEAEVFGGEVPVYGDLRKQSFNAFIDGATPTHAYTFGTSATTPTASVNAVAITNLTQLEANFNPLQDSGGGLQTVRINSEHQKYMPFSAGRHTFKTDRLVLGAYLVHPDDYPDLYPDSQPNSSLSLNGNGVAVPWDNLPPDTEFRTRMAGAKKGQWFMAKGSGTYYISAINPGVDIALRKLGSTSTSSFTNRMCVLMPIYSGPCTAYSDSNTAYSNKPTLTIDPAYPIAQPEVKAGWMVGREAGGSDDRTFQMNHDVRVESVDAANNVIVLNRTIAYGDNVGKHFSFAPGIEASQIWTKDTFQTYTAGSRICVEWDVHLFPGWTPSAWTGQGAVPLGDIPRDGNRFTFRNWLAANRNTPIGAWPGLWAYSANGSGSASTFEHDPLELFMDTTKGPFLYSTGNVGGTSAWIKQDEGWTNSGGLNRSPQILSGRHKFQFVYASRADGSGGNTYHYIDGLLVHVENYSWGNTRNIQWGMNMAFNWLSRSGGSNFQIAFGKDAFTHAQMEILSMKVWHRTGPA